MGSIACPLGRTAQLRRALYRGRAALQRGAFNRAEGIGRLTLARLGYPSCPTVAGSAFTELVASSLDLLGQVRRELGDFSKAILHYREALGILEAPGGKASGVLRVAVLGELGEALRLMGRYAEAEEHSRRAVALAKQVTPATPMLVAGALDGLGIVFKDTGRYDEAADCYDSALHIARQALGAAEHPQLATLFHNLAGLEHARQHFVDGEAHARRALRMRAKLEGLGSACAAGDLAVLGALLLGQRRYTEAEEVLRQSLSIWHRRFGSDHYEIAVVQHNLAALYAARGETVRSEAAYWQVLHIKRRIFGAEHPQVQALQDYLDQLG